MSLVLADSWAPPSPTMVRPVQDLPAHAVSVATVEALAVIGEPDVNLAIWTRSETVRVPSERTLASVDDIAVTAAVGDIGGVMLDALAAAGYPAACLSAITADIARLGQCLGGIADCASVDIRLEVVETDACRKFHADYVSVRLICSYVGAGTQWLADADAARLRAGADPDDLPIRELATGDVALFKGRRWSDDGAIVHRSPPIAGTGARRLVLVIDPARTAQADFERA